MEIWELERKDYKVLGKEVVFFLRVRVREIYFERQFVFSFMVIFYVIENVSGIEYIIFFYGEFFLRVFVIVLEIVENSWEKEKCYVSFFIQKLEVKRFLWKL